MKVIHQTSDRLELEDKPWVAAAFLLGGLILSVVVTIIAIRLEGPTFSIHRLAGLAAVVIVGSGSIVALALLQKLSVTFDRQSNIVTIIRHSLVSRTIDSRPLDDIEDAEIEERLDSDGTGLVYRVRLLAQDGKRLALTSHLSSGKGTHVAAKAISTWLAADRTG